MAVEPSLIKTPKSFKFVLKTSYPNSTPAFNFYKFCFRHLSLGQIAKHCWFNIIVFAHDFVLV